MSRESRKEKLQELINCKDLHITEHIIDVKIDPIAIDDINITKKDINNPKYYNKKNNASGVIFTCHAIDEKEVIFFSLIYFHDDDCFYKVDNLAEIHKKYCSCHKNKKFKELYLKSLYKPHGFCKKLEITMNQFKNYCSGRTKIPDEIIKKAMNLGNQ
jgi:hypothetical protein